MIGSGGRRRALQTESGRCHREIPGDAAADQPGSTIGSPVDRRARMHRPSLRPDPAGSTEVDDDSAEKAATCGQLSSDHDVDRTDVRFVRRDRGEEAVLGVRAFVFSDLSVETGNPDSHRRHERNWHASAMPSAGTVSSFATG
jgi:hypothetical protein